MPSLRQSYAMHEIPKARVRAEWVDSQIGFDEVSNIRGALLVRFFQELEGLLPLTQSRICNSPSIFSASAIGVELFLHQFWIDGLVPKMLTFEGANVDIYVGASAPLFAWLSTRGRLGMKFALAWNVLGLLALTNVVIRAVLTALGPFNLIHAEVPNLMMGAFPFMFIPAFFVPLAVVLHVLSIWAIRSRLRTASRVIGPNPQTVPHSDLIF